MDDITSAKTKVIEWKAPKGGLIGSGGNGSTLPFVIHFRRKVFFRAKVETILDYIQRITLILLIIDSRFCIIN